MSSLNKKSVNFVSIRYIYDDGTTEDHDLVESNNIYNESLIVTSCRYYNDNISNPDIIISDNDKELANIIGQSVIYQFKNNIDPQPVNDSIDYYTYLENNKVIPLRLSENVILVQVLDDESEVVVTCDLSSDAYKGCLKLLVISITSDDNFNVITEVHKMSGTPHLSYHTDIMNTYRVTEIIRSDIYRKSGLNNNMVIDNRSDNVLGLSSNNNLW